MASASTGGTAHRRVRSIAKRAGIGAVHPHMLRAALIMAALDAGVPLREVQIAARHADPRTTTVSDCPIAATSRLRQARRLRRGCLRRRRLSLRILPARTTSSREQSVVAPNRPQSRPTSTGSALPRPGDEGMTSGNREDISPRRGILRPLRVRSGANRGLEWRRARADASPSDRRPRSATC